MKEQKARRIMTSKRVLLAVVIIAVLFFVGWFTLKGTKSNESLPVNTLAVINGQPFHVRVADTQSEHELGLSYVPELKIDEGMLFVFNEQKERAVWMKGMQFPIDVVWLQSAELTAADKQSTPGIQSKYVVVGMQPELFPETYPATFPSGAPIDAFLEIPSGMVNQLQVVVGEEISIY